METLSLTRTMYTALSSGMTWLGQSASKFAFRSGSVPNVSNPQG